MNKYEKFLEDQELILTYKDELIQHIKEEYPDALFTDLENLVCWFLLNMHETLSTVSSNLCIDRFTKGCTNCSKDKGNQYISVFGKNNNEEDEYSLEFSSWKKWLGMNIAENTLSEFSDEEIVAHAIWEMTFISFDENEIQQQMDSLIKITKELEEDLAAGKTDRYKTWEEVKKELNLEIGKEK